MARARKGPDELRGRAAVSPATGLSAQLKGGARMSGAVSYHAGNAAELQVADLYVKRGMTIAARRWRGEGGEIDLVARDGNGLVFIEVKKSNTHARAAESLSMRQIRRLFDAAGEYMATCAAGLNTNARFDVALVDSVGQIEILENALSA